MTLEEASKHIDGVRESANNYRPSWDYHRQTAQVLEQMLALLEKHGITEPVSQSELAHYRERQLPRLMMENGL